MSNYQLGKDIQEILSRLSRIEGMLGNERKHEPLLSASLVAWNYAAKPLFIKWQYDGLFPPIGGAEILPNISAPIHYPSAEGKITVTVLKVVPSGFGPNFGTFQHEITSNPLSFFHLRSFEEIHGGEQFIRLQWYSSKSNDSDSFMIPASLWE